MRKGLGSAVFTATVLAALATGAGAATKDGGLLGSLSNCGYGASSQVFARWLDPFSYSLAPQGDLSSTSDWSFSGASVSSAHDPYGLSARSVVFSHNGDAATTPWMCVNLQNPSIRFLTLDQGGLGLGTFSVVLRYLAPDGSVVRLPISVAKPLRSWGPSLPVLPVLNLLSVASSSGWTEISLELHATLLAPGETISADGVWVDPCRSR